MNIVLFDEENTWKIFLPLTFTRPVSEIRIGILTIREKWEKTLGTSCSYHTQAYLSKKYPLKAGSDSVFIISNYCPNPELAKAIVNLKPGQALYSNNKLVAFGVKGMNVGDVGT